jgi:hypothetical protein
MNNVIGMLRPSDKALPMYESNDIQHNLGSANRPPGAPPFGAGGANWDNHYVGRFIRTITVPAGEYNFITRSNDGVRVRYEPVDTPDTTAPYDWNIINNWSSRSGSALAVDYKSVTLEAGDYNLFVEWFEGTGDAVIALEAGNTSFSFSDSPKGCSTDACPKVPSVPFGNSSLMLNGLLNLRRPAGYTSSTWLPKLEYYTYYDLESQASANVEVTMDGGLNWTQSRLGDNCPSSAQCGATIWGSTERLRPADWQWRVHDLRWYGNYRVNSTTYGVPVGLRFRLKTQDNVGDGWWITDITVNN